MFSTPTLNYFHTTGGETAGKVAEIVDPRPREGLEGEEAPSQEAVPRPDRRTAKKTRGRGLIPIFLFIAKIPFLDEV